MIFMFLIVKFLAYEI